MDKILEELARRPQKQKLAMLLGALLAPMVLFYFLIYDDQSGRLASRTQELQRVEGELIEKQAIAENLGKYTQEVSRLKVELERAKNLLPDESEVPALLAQIDTLGARAGLTIARFEPQKEEIKDFYARLPFRVKVSGNYHEVASFIDNVGQLERIVNVENIAMKEPTVKNKKFVLNTEFTVTTYRFIDKAAAPPPPTPKPVKAPKEGD